MPVWSALDKYWHIDTMVTGSGASACLVKSRTRDEFRFAYRRASDTRWHLSPPISENFGRSVLLVDAKRDISCGDERLRQLHHSVRTYARETVRTRWMKHKKRMLERREAAQMSTLSNFGMF